MATKPTKVTSPVQFNWAGKPYNSEVDAYGGKPEHWPASERMKHARQALQAQPVTQERREAMLKRMAHAREVMRMRKLKAKDKAKQSGVITTETAGYTSAP